ncbi:MAG: DUF4491 family protein [Clostridium fessum]
MVPSYCYICGVLLWKPLLAGIFAGGHFVYDSIRKNAGNTFVGFLGVLGVSCFWSIKELKEQEKRVAKGWFPKRKVDKH